MRRIQTMERNQQIAQRYVDGEHAVKLGKEYGISTRQIQRICKKEGVIKTRSESYLLAIKQDRMVFYKKPEHLKVTRKTISPAMRYDVLRRDGYTCRLCGAVRNDGIRLEVDHIDNDRRNNALNNLQTLCDECNKGKAYNSSEWKEYQEDRRRFFKNAV